MVRRLLIRRSCADLLSPRRNWQRAIEAGAQPALDASGLTRLPSDGVVLMRAVVGALGIGPLNLPWAEGPRLWRAEDIAAHLPLFEDYAAIAGLLAKAGAWDESKHPPVPAGSPDHQAGRFIHGEGGAVAECQQAVPGLGHNGGPPLGQPPEILEEDPLAENLRKPLVSVREAPYP